MGCMKQTTGRARIGLKWISMHPESGIFFCLLRFLPPGQPAKVRTMKIPLTALALSFLLYPLTGSALPASQSHSGREVVKASRLEGSWVSTNLSGDAIWLVVQQVGVTFKDDGTFTASAVLDGGSRDNFAGPYHLDEGKIRLDPKGQSALICTYSIKNGVLTLYNAQHGITATFKRGELPSASSNSSNSPDTGGMPGMHF